MTAAGNETKAQPCEVCLVKSSAVAERHSLCGCSLNTVPCQTVVHCSDKDWPGHRPRGRNMGGAMHCRCVWCLGVPDGLESASHWQCQRHPARSFSKINAHAPDERKCTMQGSGVMLHPAHVR